MGLIDDDCKKGLAKYCVLKTRLGLGHVPRTIYILLLSGVGMVHVHIFEEGLRYKCVSKSNQMSSADVTNRVTGNNNPIVGFLLGKLKGTRSTPKLSLIGLAVIDEDIDDLG